MDPTRDYERIERAIRFLDAATSRPTLGELATHLGLSPHHVQRLFKRYAGLTPSQFVRYTTAAYARERLRASRTVLETTLDVGLSGPGRLHDLLVSVDAVTPGEVRSGGAGLVIRYGRHGTPFGPASLAVSPRGIVALAFTEADPRPTLARDWPRATLRADPSATAPVCARIFERTEPLRPLPLLLRGTNLQIRVWEALLRIPQGAVVSYGALAHAVGRPTAARAVARAVGANRIAYLVPCHRVLRATGALGGYRWGSERKRLLLAGELSAAPPAPAPG